MAWPSRPPRWRIPHAAEPRPGHVAGRGSAAGLPAAGPADHGCAGGLGGPARRRPDPGPAGAAGRLASRLSVLVLLAAFAVANSALRTAAQRRLSQVRAVARVAQSAVLREVPTTVTAGRLASRYVSAAAEARVGGDLLEVVSERRPPALAHRGHPRKGIACGPPRQPRYDQLPRRVRPAGPGADRDRPGRGSVGRAGGRRRGLRDRRVRRVRPARLASARHLRPPAAPAAGCRRRPAAADTQSHTRHRSACTPTSSRPRSRSARATGWCSTPTACWRRATGRGRSSGWKTARHAAQPDLEAAADELLGRLMAHTGRRLDDDIALLLFEAASPETGLAAAVLATARWPAWSRRPPTWPDSVQDLGGAHAPRRRRGGIP